MNFTYSLEGIRNPTMRQTLTDLANDLGDAIDNVNVTLAAAVSGDLIFSISPATVDAEIDDQNVGTAQVITGVVSGLVAAAGAGDIIVTVTSAELDGGSKDVTVALANDDDASDIAGKIRTAVAADTDISDSGSALFTVTGSTTSVILTRNAEAANDDTLDIAVATDDAEFAIGNDLAIANTDTTAGVAPYTRTVTCKLVDTAGNTHTWYTDNVAMTIAETTAGSGTAAMSGTDKDGGAVTGDDNYGFVNGECTVTVTCTGAWADDDTNTVTISQKTILGATVTAKTSVESSIDT
jgi:hypothetical protein